MTDLPRAPDAFEHQERLIELTYDINAGGHAAYRIEHGVGVTTRRRICRMKDGEEMRAGNEAALSTLKSWSITRDSHIVEVPQAVSGDRVLLLHDTPQVRALLHKIDSDHCINLSHRLQEIIDEAHASGYSINCFSQAHQTTWTAVPSDIRTKIYKGEWELHQDFLNWQRYTETAGRITVEVHDEAPYNYDKKHYRIVRTTDCRGQRTILKIFKRVA